MCKKFKFLILTILYILYFSGALCAQRKMENLGRGLVALRSSNNEVFLSWRILAREYEKETTYTLYRDNEIIKTGLSVSNYVDQNSNNNSMYSVSATVDGVEFKPSEKTAISTYKHGTNSMACYRIPIHTNPGYTPYNIWVGDLDGDGEYDYVLCCINWAANTPILVEAYTSKGVFLWSYNCGPNSYNKDNISPGSSSMSMGHGDNLTVYDINNDGMAEVIVRSANGVVFGDGKKLTEPNNNKQFISVLEGTTGKEIARGQVPTDFIANGPVQGHMGIAYLDGVNPSVVYSAKNRRPDKGFNQLVATWNMQNDTLLLNWKFLRDRAKENSYPDGHQIRIIDLDGDGKDEITPFGFALNDDGKVLYTLSQQGVYHGDRFFIGDMDPDREGLEGYGIQQGYSPTGIIWYYYDAKTGKIIHKQEENPIIGHDYARGMVGDFDPRHPGFEFFTFTDGQYNVNGKKVTSSLPDSYPNLRIWWDGDLLSENLDNNKMTKWDYIADINNSEIRLFSFSSNVQADRKVPAFYGDILGDWREEAVYISNDLKNILVFSTTTPTQYGFYTLPQNPAYRNCFTVRGYYQSHMLDYYLGEGMKNPPVPKIQLNQKSEKQSLASGIYTIKSLASDLFLDTINGLSQQDKNNKLGQIWKITRKNDVYQLFSLGTGKHVNYKMKDNTVELYFDNKLEKGDFSIVENADHSYSIVVNADSTLVLSVDKNLQSTAGAKIVADKQLHQPNQHFIFTLTHYQDCNKTWNGTAFIDSCGTCVGGNTGKQACTATSLNEALYHKTLNIDYYPNPVSNVLTVVTQGSNLTCGLSVFNSRGVCIDTFSLSEGQNHIGFQNYPAGLYLCLVRHDGKTKAFKITKQ